jgi:dTDP-4-dehydrorhamnose reductase
MRLLLGANGQLGRHLAARDSELVTCARRDADHCLDLADCGQLESLLDRLRPSTVINAAAWTAVDEAEDHADAAFELNRDLPARLADWCRSHQAVLVHYSTDYVFSGQPGRPWREDDPVAPESIYGRSKLAGEQAIADSGCRAWILRTAWVYSALPGNFVSAILGRAADGQSLRVVDDQSGSPTWAGTLAEATLRLLAARDAPDEACLLHVAGRGTRNWYQLAVEAVQLAVERGIIPESVAIEPIGSSEWPQKAPRPAWSVLDCRRFEALVDWRLPDCRQALVSCLNQWSDAPC